MSEGCLFSMLISHVSYLSRMFHLAAYELQLRACNRIYQHKHVSVWVWVFVHNNCLWLFDQYMLILLCVCEWVKGGWPWLYAEALDWRINSLRCSIHTEKERERERGNGGARHLHPRGRWMDGEMEEGRDRDKQWQWGQGSVKEMEEGGKITPLQGYTYSTKMTDCKAKTSHPAF